jgi:hypothetical protein
VVAIVVAGNKALKRSQLAGSRPLGSILWFGLVSILLIMLGVWTICYTWPLKSIRLNELAFSDQAAQRFRDYPDAQYAFGMHAWVDQQPEKAAIFFRQAVSQNVLFIDAWLRLAETRTAMEHDAEAGAILAFVAQMTDQVLRWKWPQMVLASQLGMSDRFYGNANDLLTRGTLEQDTLQLLHTHLDGDASAVIHVLEPQNLTAYLEWLMRWGMTEESLAVWQAMGDSIPADKTLALRYAHFLLSHKRVSQSVDIWRQYTGSNGMTNPGFEDNITRRQGFDWHFTDDKEGNWQLKRVFSESAEGNHAIQLKFNGKANIVFYHLYQILAVTPEASYRLTYAWKSKGITTDQGPFVEIFGYDKCSIHETGATMTGSHAWHDDSIDFTAPAGCRAVVVRLRRKTSMRFDSKIRGKIWLDDFRLEKLAPES